MSNDWAVAQLDAGGLVGSMPRSMRSRQKPWSLEPMEHRFLVIALSYD